MTQRSSSFDRGLRPRDQPLLGKDLLLVEVLDEEGTGALEDLLEVLDDSSAALPRSPRGSRDRFALLDAGGEVVAAKGRVVVSPGRS
jgi:hypothetical protein